MKTAEFKVNSQGLGMSEALAATEGLGRDSGLEGREILRLRLMGEELFGLMRGITGELEADYAAELDNGVYALRLVGDVPMNQEMRRQLIAVSSSGENAAAKGFTGKLREMIAVALLPRDAGPSMLSMGFMSMGSPGGYRAGAGCDWSMTRYKEKIGGGRGAGEDTDEAWDELEKSIVASLADEVSVSVKGSHVEITVSKSF